MGLNTTKITINVWGTWRILCLTTNEKIEFWSIYKWKTEYIIVVKRIHWSYLREIASLEKPQLRFSFHTLSTYWTSNPFIYWNFRCVCFYGLMCLHRARKGLSKLFPKLDGVRNREKVNKNSPCYSVEERQLKPSLSEFSVRGSNSTKSDISTTTCLFYLLLILLFAVVPYKSKTIPLPCCLGR